MKALRTALVVIGTIVWIPYAIFKYALHDPFPVGWVLVIHVPCMLGALALRIWAWNRNGAGGGKRGAERTPETK